MRETVRRRWLPLAPVAAATIGAAGLTYAFAGYRYGVWPQPGLLESVLALKGQLPGVRKSSW